MAKYASSTNKFEESFFIKAARGADGQGEPTSDGFVVFKNAEDK